MSVPHGGALVVRVGDYELVRVLGRGGLSEVFLAEHRLTGRRVALKLQRPVAPGSTPSIADECRQRMLCEARALAEIDHRNVVRVIDFGEHDDGRVFIVMEYLAGTTLRMALDTRGPLPGQTLVPIGILVARGLRAAHERGLVHRDLKPGNVMLSPIGHGRFTAKIFDFGITKFIDEPGITKWGYVPGTPQYMSPEQRRGDDLDQRADFYSFGVLLHHTWTGQYPIADGEARTRRFRPTPFDVKLASLIDICLREDRRERFQTTNQLIAALEEVHANGQPAPDASWAPASHEHTMVVAWTKRASEPNAPPTPPSLEIVHAPEPVMAAAPMTPRSLELVHAPVPVITVVAAAPAVEPLDTQPIRPPRKPRRFGRLEIILLAVTFVLLGAGLALVLDRGRTPEAPLAATPPPPPPRPAATPPAPGVTSCAPVTPTIVERAPAVEPAPPPRKKPKARRAKRVESADPWL